MMISEMLICAFLFQGGWEPLHGAAWIEKSVRLASNPVEKTLLRLQDSPNGYSRPDQSIWTGNKWHRVARIPVEGRQEQVLAYDPVNQGILLFGGGRNLVLSNDKFMGDTWLWRGGKWSLLGPLTSPSPRYYNSFATDTRRKRIVCWDGGDGTMRFGRHFPDQVWEWDGKNWNLIQPKIFPKPRWQGAMTYDPVSGRVLLFGGTGGPFFGSVPLDDLWEWDGKTWTEQKPAPQQPWPLARGWGQRFVYFPKLRKCLLVGGAPSNTQKAFRFTDTWAWDGKTKRWARLHSNGSIPGFPVFLDSMAVDPVSQNMILVGRTRVKGSGLPGPRETWIHDGKKWSKAFRDPDHPSYLLQAAWDPRGDRYIGFNLVNTVENGVSYSQLETWEFKVGAGWRKLLGPGFKSRAGFSKYQLITHEDAGVLILLENRGSSGRTFLWDSSKDRWTRETRHLPGVLGGGNRVCYDSKLKAITYFSFDRSLYRWTPEKGWTKDPSFRLPLRVRGTWQWDGKVAYDPLRDRFVLCRPSEGSLPWPNWEWDRMTWRSIPGLGGLARFGIHDFHLVAVPELGGTLLIGGEYVRQNVWWGNNPCFLWDGKNWVELGWARYPEFPRSSSSRPRSMFYDRGRRQLVSFHTLISNQSGMRLRVGGLRALPNFARPGSRLPLEIHEPKKPRRFFVLGLSLGAWPGLPFVDTRGTLRRLPVAGDPLFLQSLGWGALGMLDAKGRAQLSLPIPGQKVLAGLEFYGAAVILGNGGVEKGTNEVALQILR